MEHLGTPAWALMPIMFQQGHSGMHVYLLALGIGFVAGLRTFTAPAAVSWGAYLGRLNLHSEFIKSGTAIGLLSLLAVSEYIADLLPKTPNRTAPAPLLGRIITGGLSGALLSISADQPWIAAGFLGAVGAVLGAFAGYNARKKLVETFKVKDWMIAMPEDVIAIGLAYLMVIA